MAALDAGARLQLFVAAFRAHDKTIERFNINGSTEFLLFLKEALLLNMDPPPGILNGISILPCMPRGHIPF